MRIFRNITAIVAALAGAATAQAVIVNVSSIDGTGATISLAAGTYRLRLIGTGDGGAYDGWNAWGGNLNCDGSGGNCDNGYIEQFGYDLGVDGVFDHIGNGRYFTLNAIPGQTYRYASGALALAVYSGMIESSPLDHEDYSPATMPLTFTLAQAQRVNFWIGDSNYYLNIGGVSLNVAAVPEPAGWATMIAGFGMIGAASRRRTRIRFA